MLELPLDLPAELVPLSWLIGEWEGTGVLDYQTGEAHVQREFDQRVSFGHNGQRYLSYSSASWVRDKQHTPLSVETGYWRLSRAAVPGDAGPGMLPGAETVPFADPESVETLRNSDGAFDIEVSLVHPDGVSELYLGQIAGPRIDLATDAVLRGSGAKEYTAATRLYGLVDGHLLWAWDIAALGQPLRTHASARLARLENADQSTAFFSRSPHAHSESASAPKPSEGTVGE